MSDANQIKPSQSRAATTERMAGLREAHADRGAPRCQ